MRNSSWLCLVFCGFLIGFFGIFIWRATLLDSAVYPLASSSSTLSTPRTSSASTLKSPPLSFSHSPVSSLPSSYPSSPIVAPTSTQRTVTDALPEFQFPAGFMSSLEVEVWLTEPRRIESVALEEYVSGVVAAEMSADFPDEALKAQAIAARTYIVRHLLNNPGEPVTDTTQQQAYTSRDIAQNLAGFDRIQAATLATAGQILLYEDEPIEALYFSTSNGYTANGEDYYEGANLPYLRSVASPWDEAISPQYEQTQTFSAAQVRRLLDLTEQQLAEMTITQRTSGGYVQTVTAGRQQRTGRAVREALGLASADFTWSFDGDHVTFTTLGYGHGVGMSQYGARGMAADGNRYQEILAYYYPSTELVTISKI